MLIGNIPWVIFCTLCLETVLCESCGGIIRAASGWFSPPDTDEDGFYEPNSECLWTIVADGNQRIELVITDIDIEEHAACLVLDFDYIEIRDGNVLKGRYCESSEPISVTSDSNVIIVKFSSDSSIDYRRGFNATYQQITDPFCGYKTAFLAGLIKSVDLNRDGYYDNRAICVWQIIPMYEYQNVQVYVTEIDIVPGFRCNTDYLQIRDSDVFLPTTRYCGLVSPPLLTSNHTSVYVIFQSDIIGVRKGFTALYAYTDDARLCGGILTETEGIIDFNYRADSYDQVEDFHCVWIIVASKDKQIELEVVDNNMAWHQTCDNCYLSVYDGYYSYPFEGLRGTYCGNGLPPVISSLSSVLYVEYFCDRSVTWRLKINYKHVNAVEVPCDGVLTNTTGWISSPDVDGDGYYDPSRNCRWIIFAGENKNIQLIIVEFHLQEDDTCYYDYLEVYDGLILKGKYCGSLEQFSTTSSARMLTVLFSSDLGITGTGFRAVYQQVTDPMCGYLTSFLAGSIELVTNEEGLYDNNMLCVWSIETPSPGLDIQIYVTKMDIETSQDCTLDYLQVSDMGGSLPMTKYCGKIPPPLLTATHHSVMVIFRSNSLVTAEGFTAVYAYNDESRGCGGILNETQGRINPTASNDDEHCVWVIVSSEDVAVHLKISARNFGIGDSCEHNYVKVFAENYSYPFNGSIGSYCGDNLLGEIHSVSNVLFVEYFSDSTGDFSGFRALYEHVQKTTSEPTSKYTYVASTTASMTWPTTSLDIEETTEITVALTTNEVSTLTTAKHTSGEITDIATETGAEHTTIETIDSTTLEYTTAEVIDSTTAEYTTTEVIDKTTATTTEYTTEAIDSTTETTTEYTTTEVIDSITETTTDYTTTEVIDSTTDTPVEYTTVEVIDSTRKTTADYTTTEVIDSTIETAVEYTTAEAIDSTTDTTAEYRSSSGIRAITESTANPTTGDLTNSTVAITLSGVTSQTASTESSEASSLVEHGWFKVIISLLTLGLVWNNN